MVKGHGPNSEYYDSPAKLDLDLIVTTKFNLDPKLKEGPLGSNKASNTENTKVPIDLKTTFIEMTSKVEIL